MSYEASNAEVIGDILSLARGIKGTIEYCRIVLYLDSLYDIPIDPTRLENIINNTPELKDVRSRLKMPTISVVETPVAVTLSKEQIESDRLLHDINRHLLEYVRFKTLHSTWCDSSLFEALKCTLKEFERK